MISARVHVLDTIIYQPIHCKYSIDYENLLLNTFVTPASSKEVKNGALFTFKTWKIQAFIGMFPPHQWPPGGLHV